MHWVPGSTRSTRSGATERSTAASHEPRASRPSPTGPWLGAARRRCHGWNPCGRAHWQSTQPSPPESPRWSVRLASIGFAIEAFSRRVIIFRSSSSNKTLTLTSSSARCRHKRHVRGGARAHAKVEARSSASSSRDPQSGGRRLSRWLRRRERQGMRFLGRAERARLRRWALEDAAGSDDGDGGSCPGERARTGSGVALGTMAALLPMAWTCCHPSGLDLVQLESPATDRTTAPTRCSVSTRSWACAACSSG